MLTVTQKVTEHAAVQPSLVKLNDFYTILFTDPHGQLNSFYFEITFWYLNVLVELSEYCGLQGCEVETRLIEKDHPAPQCLLIAKVLLD